jgi:hypothetical protein
VKSPTTRIAREFPRTSTTGQPIQEGAYRLFADKIQRKSLKNKKISIIKVGPNEYMKTKDIINDIMSYIYGLMKTNNLP